MNYRGYVYSPGSNLGFLRNGLFDKITVSERSRVKKQSVSRVMCVGFFRGGKNVFKNRKLKRTFSDIKLKSYPTPQTRNQTFAKLTAVIV